MSSLAWLYERFEAKPSAPFIIWRDRPFTYAWLSARAADWRARLDAAGVAPGSVTALEGDYSPQAIALLLALIERRAVVVPLTATVKAHRAEFLDIAQAQVVISFMEHEEGEISRREQAVTNPLLLQLRRINRPPAAFPALRRG